MRIRPTNQWPFPGTAPTSPMTALSTTTSLTHLQNTKELFVLNLRKGYGHYQDYSVVYGDAQAERTFSLVTNYCELDMNRYIANAERIACLPSTNPNEIEGVGELLVRFAMELYLAVRQEKLFSNQGIFKYEFFRMASYRLYLQKKGIF